MNGDNEFGDPWRAGNNTCFTLLESFDDEQVNISANENEDENGDYDLD